MKSILYGAVVIVLAGVGVFVAAPADAATLDALSPEYAATIQEALFVLEETLDIIQAQINAGQISDPVVTSLVLDGVADTLSVLNTTLVAIEKNAYLASLDTEPMVGVEIIGGTNGMVVVSGDDVDKESSGLASLWASAKNITTLMGGALIILFIVVGSILWITRRTRHSAPKPSSAPIQPYTPQQPELPQSHDFE